MYCCEDCNRTFDEPDIRTETWDDPGVYPSGAGGYALPSYDYEVECCPYCENEDYGEVKECKLCGKYFCPYDLDEKGLCEECGEQSEEFN